MRFWRFMIWFDPRSDFSVAGFWWYGKDGYATAGFIIRPPWSAPLFSEHYGYHKPVLKFRGWRLFGPRPRLP